MFKIIQKTVLLVLCTALIIPITGCGSTSVMGVTSEEVVRKFTPRFKRKQIFSNNPTAYNQQRFHEVDEKDVIRKLRNGTMGVGDEYRMKERNHSENREVAGYEEDTEDSYGKGYEDGCRTYMDVVGNGLYRVMGSAFDADRMLNDSWYLRGFQDAASFCTFRTDWEIH